MLDIQYIRDNWRELQKRIKTKGVELDLGALIKIDDERRKILKKTEDLRAMKNKASLEIAKAAAAQKKKLIEDVKAFDRDAEKLEKTLSGLTAGWSSLLEQIPNPPAPDVKVGRDSSANEIIRVVGWHKDGSFGEGGGPRQFDFKPQSAEELGAALGLIDTARAGKVAGSRFGYLVGGAALLEFALIRYALDRLLLKGFIPILPPVLVKPEIMAGMGYLARGGDEETYRITRFDDDLYLVGTSEQSVVSYHTGEILEASALPRRYAAFSTCFRREAGSYGKDTKGILRVHQFDKLEMVSFTAADKSDEEHELLRQLEEELVAGLELPYRLVKLCTGDLGDPAVRTYDIETWMPGQNCYRETHSASNTTDFQARRLGIRYRPGGGGATPVHILNGTAFAMGRTIIAILENYQRRDGSVETPRALHPYLPQGFAILKKS